MWDVLHRLHREGQLALLERDTGRPLRGFVGAFSNDLALINIVTPECRFDGGVVIRTDDIEFVRWGTTALRARSGAVLESPTAPEALTMADLSSWLTVIDRLAVDEPVLTLHRENDSEWHGPSYTDFLKSAFCPSSSLEFRVGLDCANGAASRVAPALFEQLGVPTLVWHASPDGVNINQQCGALHPEFLQRKVRDERLDLGFAFDGDADRLIAIDHTGEILDGDYILAICAQALNTAGALCPRAVVSTVMSNLGLDRALRNLGIVLHQTQVGDRYVMQAMQHHGAILGGEQSGHIIFLKHQTTGDGLLSAIQLLNAVSSQQAPLADLAQVLFKFPQVLINVAIQRRDDPLNYPHVQHALQNAQAALGDEGRVLVRLSGTEPVARVMVEGPEQTLIESLAQRIAQAVASELGCG